MASCFATLVQYLHDVGQSTVRMVMPMVVVMVVGVWMVVVVMMVVTMKPIEEKETMVMVVVMLVAIQVFHVVVMVVVLEDDVEVAGVNPCLCDAGDACLKSRERKALQSLVEHFGVCPQVKQRGHGHVAADACVAFQIQFLTHVFLLCKWLN